MGSQLELLNELKRCAVKFGKELPDVGAAHAAFTNEVYKDGALSRKVKRLMALAIALRTGCTSCMTYQIKSAVDAGATKAEILEATSVGIAMGGAPANAWMCSVVKTLEELGEW